MLMGVLIKNTNVESVKGKNIGELLKDDVCLLIVDDTASIIYIWVGQKANVKDKFIISRLAHGINSKMFGMAAKVSQDANDIQEKFNEKIFDDDLPSDLVFEIIG